MTVDLSDHAAEAGAWAYALALELWPITRSLTGPGVRETLSILSRELDGLRQHRVASGSRAFDWTVPDEWTFRAAYIIGPDGSTVLNASENNLHVLGYSTPVDARMDLFELNAHLYSLPEQPDAIPYVTSYYKQRWGFCLSHAQRQSLSPGQYRVVIDADLTPGHLDYGELVIPGETADEIFLSTYICHPSMANNELSGPVVTAALARWWMQSPRKHSLRIAFVPETIGSLVYMSSNLEVMKAHTRAGFNVTCVGDDRIHSFLPSRHGQTRADRIGRHVLRHMAPNFVEYTWLDRGSDERQYCAPGADLPVTTLMRSKYAEYPEYHTSLDRLGSVVTAEGLSGGFLAIARAIDLLETDFTPRVTMIGEPQLGKRGLYPDISVKGSAADARVMMNMISYCDGTHSLFEIAEMIGQPFWSLQALMKPLVAERLVEVGSGLFGEDKIDSNFSR